MEILIGSYRIRPYRDTCWQIDEWDEGGGVHTRGEKKGEPVAPHWAPLNYYPETLPFAFQHVWELCAKRSPERRDCKAAIAALAEMTEALTASVRRVKS